MPGHNDLCQKPEQEIGDKTDDTYHDQTGKNNIRSQKTLGLQNDVTESGGSSHHFRHHKVSPCPADSQSEIIHKSRKGSRKDYLGVNLQLT